MQANRVAAAPIVTATGLRKTYGQGAAAVRAVDEIDLELAPGEFLAIMGASGSGKSTLLHLLAGLVRADGGAVRIAGSNVSQLSDAALTRFRSRHVGVVFQAYNLLPTLTALDNVALPLLLVGRSRSAARSAARQRLEEVGLSVAASRRPPQLSGGEQQRVAVARSLVNDPQLVLADEPTGNLDRSSADVVCRLLRDVVANERRAVAVVTHEPHVAAYADRVMVLADGRVVDHFPRTAVDSVEALGLRALQASESRSVFADAAL